MSIKLVLVVIGIICVVASFITPAFPALAIAVLFGLLAHIVP